MFLLLLLILILILILFLLLLQLLLFLHAIPLKVVYDLAAVLSKFEGEGKYPVDLAIEDRYSA